MADEQEICVFCGASSARVGLMEDDGVWRCINEYNCAEREEAKLDSPE